MDNLIDCLNDISKINIIYTILLLASVENIRLFSINDQGGYTIDEQFNCNQGLGLITLNYIIAAMNYNNSFLADDSLDSELYDGDGSATTTTTTTSASTLTSTTTLATTTTALITAAIPENPCLLNRIARRLALLSGNFIVYLENQFNEHTATSIASFSVLIIVLSIICCFIISLMREEERKIKEQYKKLNTGSSQSFIAINGTNQQTTTKTTTPRQQARQQVDCVNDSNGGGGVRGSSMSIKQRFINNNNDRSPSNKLMNINNKFANLTSYLSSPINGAYYNNYTTIGGSDTYKSTSPSAVASSNSNSNSNPNHHHHNKIHVIELRRETYFGLLRLLKPGCRTIVLFCDTQSKLKLLSKFYQCIYPYRKNKTLHFAFLLIEKNIGWYKDLLKLALNEKRDLQINPINCIGTVLVLSGFKKYFSVYHASDSRCEPDEQFILEESLLDNFPDWLERLFAGKISRYYVECWPDGMR